MPFGQGHRVSRASYQSLVPRSGSSFLIPGLTYRFITISWFASPEHVYCLLIRTPDYSADLGREEGPGRKVEVEQSPPTQFILHVHKCIAQGV